MISGRQLLRAGASASASAAVSPSLAGTRRAAMSSTATAAATASASASGSRSDNDDDGAAAAAAAPSSRWLSDVRARVQRGISSKADRPAAAAVVDRLKDHARYLDEHWLQLSAGREGYLTEARWRGLDGHGVAWGDMDAMGHVNNVRYNRFAESGRVNWIMNVASHVSPENRQEFRELMTPRGIGLILASIRTDYKFPMTFPDQVTVLHRLVAAPDATSDRILMEAVAYSHRHKRLAARFFEDIAVYDYRAGSKAPLRPFMVEEMQRVYRLQGENRQRAERQAQELSRSLDELGV